MSMMKISKVKKQKKLCRELVVTLFPHKITLFLHKKLCRKKEFFKIKKKFAENGLKNLKLKITKWREVQIIIIFYNDNEKMYFF